MRQHITGNFLETTVSLIVVKTIRPEKVIGYVKVGKTVIVIIKPRSGKTLVGPKQPHLVTDVLKSRSVVSKKVIVFSRLSHIQAIRGMEDDIIQLTVLLLDYGDAFAECNLDTQALGSRGQMGFAIGHQVTVQITVQIIVCESHLYVGTFVSNA